jgi:site-specific DNA-methyltransferase (adenine-specific)
MNYELKLGDTLEKMKEIPDGSIDMILCDLPYGTTACKWDTVIPFEPLWEAYRRVTKMNAAIVLTASQPFTTVLIMSNMKDFKYELIWDKGAVTGFALAKTRPLKVHENVCVFYAAQPTYNPQKTKGRPNNAQTKGNVLTEEVALRNGSQPTMKKYVSDVSGEKYPISVIYEKRGGPTTLQHPTQKPVALMEYLIKTYTNPGELVLDNTMGSGTTGVACMNTGRRFIGIERDDKYFAICQERIHRAYVDSIDI